MDERARQGAERFRRAAVRTGGALSQAAGRAAEQAGAWGRAAGQAGQAASEVAGQVAGHAARAADAARSVLPGGIRSGQEFEGTLFQRRLVTALATRPHMFSLGTSVLGASPLRTGLSFGWRRKRTLEREGFDTTIAPGGVLDADELIHIHGRRLPRIMRDANLGFLTRRRQDKELRPTESGSATGSLNRVTVSEADRRRGAVDWDRLCVDINLADSADDNQHIDVLVAPIGRDGAEYAADMRLLLPEWLPPRAAQALVARPDRPTVRLHLLGEGWVSVDDGARFRLYEGVPHAMRGSLVMTGGRATRAELWISDRSNIGPGILEFLGEIGGELAAF